MPSQPCINKITCDCENSPFANLSSEAPDVPDFFALGYASAVPPLGTTFGKVDCATVCEASTPAGAELCAYLGALECTVIDWQPPCVTDCTAGVASPPPVNPPGSGKYRTYTNEPQEGTVFCPDGLPYTQMVEAGKFGAYGPVSGPLAQAAADQANAKAKSYALAQAQLHRLCLSGIQASVCAGTAYAATITASSLFLAQAPAGDVWELTDGALPPGLTIPEFIFDTGVVTGGVIHLQGTPTTPGVYNFSIAVSLPNGDNQNKPYTINVAGITNGLALPAGMVGTAYNAQLTSLGVTHPIYSVEVGALPTGLSLDAPGGVISGTPTTPTMLGFTFGVTEAGTGVTCDSPGQIVVTGASCFSDPTNLPAGATTVHYEYDFNPIPVLDGGDVWNPTVVAGTLPPGLNVTVLAGNVVLFGTPTTPGTYCFTVNLDETPGGGGGS